MSKTIDLNTHEISAHMRQLGLSIMGRAASEATFSEMMRPYAHSIAVGIAAHGAEVAIKGRIAQKNLLSIFTKIPKPADANHRIQIEDLFINGRTLQFNDLPAALLKVTGIKIPNVDQFQKFGLLRNRIIHSGASDENLSPQILKFLFEIMEPLTRQFWNESIVKYATEWDEVTVSDGYLEEALRNCGVVITPTLREAINAEK